MFIEVRRMVIRKTVNTRSLRLGVSLAVLLSVLAPTKGTTQSAPADQDESGVQALSPRAAAPEMAEHRFTSISIVRSPFVRTYYKNSLGVGATTGLTLPPIEIGGNQVQFETGSILFTTLRIEYQQAATEWLGVWADLQVAGRLGTETESLLSQGVTVVSGYDFGWLIQAWQSDDLLVSGMVQLTNASYTAVDLIGFVEGVADDGLTQDDRLVFTSPLMFGSTGVSCAWAPSRTVGVTAAANLGYGESVDQNSSNKWYSDIGAAVDLDLRRNLPVPLGVAGGIRFASIPTADQQLEGNATTLALRTDYIGRHDLSLGLEFASQWQDIRGLDNSMRYTTMTMDFRYYF
jgi:hypothetical protein